MLLRRAAMIEYYDPESIEKKWQDYWRENAFFAMPVNLSMQKYYILGMWAYPSGDAHIGHVRNYTITDVVARYKRMKGFNVLNPTGWDAFGLPTENAAFKKKIEPSAWNKVCTQRMEEQFRSLGFSYDWSNVIDTSDPSYYRWTQWLLLKFWERGILYRAKREVNWCTGCMTVLANEQVNEGRCDRCNSKVVLRELEQWFLRMSNYAERLLDDLELLSEWPQHIVTMQRHWIGKKEDGSYNLHDWCISRQRYWGAPMPFVICEHCGVQPVPEDDLPVILPEGVDITPGWPPPLARIPSFVETTCPKCQGKAERVTDVMDTFVFSAWYYLRFVDPQNNIKIFEPSREKYWMPVDLYVGGVEHATVHLIYARFFHKVLYDLGLVSQPEPFKRLFTQGMVCLRGEKMSKSKGNVVSPVQIVKQYGADTLRTFILFVGPPEQDVDWSNQGIKGCYRFLGKTFGIISGNASRYDRSWRGKIDSLLLTENDQLFRRKLHQCIRKVTAVVDHDLHFKTAISTLMQFINELNEYAKADPSPMVLSEALECTTILLYPFAPHLAEELWQHLGYNTSICLETWPEYSQKFVEVEMVGIVIQVNGKKRGMLNLSSSEALLEGEVIQKAKDLLSDRGIDVEGAVKTVYVPSRIINFVLKH
jgi:leucyl-tRNA synthetase